jgi:hypothetical protein
VNTLIPEEEREVRKIQKRKLERKIKEVRRGRA